MRRAARFLAAGGALLLLAAALGCSSDADKRDGHLAAADEYIERGELREATIELRKALRYDPQNADVNFRIAGALESQGMLGDALFFYSEARRLDPEHLEATLREAELLVFEDADRADEIAALALERDPSSARAHLVQSRTALIRADTDAALESALRAVELDPVDPATHGQVGAVYQARVREGQLTDKEVADADFEAGIAAFERQFAKSDDSVAWSAKLEKANLIAAWPDHREQAAAAFAEALEAARRAAPAAEIKVLVETVNFARQAGLADLQRDTLEELSRLQPQQIRHWTQLARLEEDRGGSADEVFARMLEVNPSTEFQVTYALELARRGRVDEAVAHLEEQVSQSEDPPVILAALVNLLTGAERLDEARAVVQRMEREYPDHPKTTISAARLLLRDDKPQEAVERLRLLVAEQETAQAWLLLAQAYVRSGNASSALQAAERAIELSRGIVFPGQALHLEARLQATLGNCPAALRSYAQLQNNGWELATAERVTQATCLFNMGRIGAGRSLLAQILERAPVNPEAVLAFARLEGEAQPERAREQLARSALAHPKDPRLLAGLARLDLRQGKPARALENLNTAIAAGGGTSEVLLTRARVLAAMGQLDAAQQDALQVFEAQPDTPGAGELLVSLYRAQGKEQEIVESFEEAESAGALRAPARYLLAKLHLALGNSNRAAELLEKVVEERGDLPGPKNDLAFLLADSGRDLDRALTLAEEAAGPLGNRPAVADTLGYVYLKKGLPQPALAQFRFAVENSLDTPGEPLFRYHLGLALLELDQRDEAARQFEQALELNGEMEEAEQALQNLRAESSPPAAEGSS